jgi:hypothetical protein
MAVVNRQTMLVILAHRIEACAARGSVHAESEFLHGKL